MNEKELRELNIFCAEHVMEWKLRDNPARLNDGEYFVYEGGAVFYFREGHGLIKFSPTDNSADSMQVLKRCYKYDRNSCLSSLHNFLMRKEHDTTLTELQICLFAKQLFSE